MDQELSMLIVLIGTLFAGMAAIRGVFTGGKIQPLVGYVVVGLIVRAIGDSWDILPSQSAHTFEFLSNVGIIVLMFGVGLESNLKSLTGQARRASFLAIFNVLVSGGVGFFASNFLLGFGVIPSLFVATAFSVTSIGVTVSLWKEAGVLRSNAGQTLLDLAAMDDIAGIVFLALLLGLAPYLYNGGGGDLFSVFLSTGSLFIVSLFGFGLVCFLFSRFVEPRLMAPPTKALRMPAVVSSAFLIAGIAGVLGFSEALGGFFAGLAFSRDPKAIGLENSFKILSDLFGPFFFFGIGYSIPLLSLEGVTTLVVVFAIVAVIGKVVGTMIPAYLTKLDFHTALALGVSMVPRAEISMVVIKKGASLGSWAVSDELFASLVFVALITCVFAGVFVPPAIRLSKEC